jgi:hypothetical protein
VSPNLNTNLQSKNTIVTKSQTTKQQKILELKNKYKLQNFYIDTTIKIPIHKLSLIQPPIQSPIQLLIQSPIQSSN